MMGDTKAMRNEIIATQPLMRYTITKETTKTSMRLELCSFIRRKRDKASITKIPKRWVVRSLTIKKLKWWFVVYNWWRNTINGVHSSECGLTLKALRKRGRNEKGVDNIKNVTMFSFCTTICWKVYGQDCKGKVPWLSKNDRKDLSLYSWALSDRKNLTMQLNCVSIILWNVW